MNPGELPNQIERYSNIRPDFELLARKLRQILEAAFEPTMVGVIVQARAKTIDSYAEKIVRKLYKYADPVRDITDLCGARVILNTTGEVEHVCRYLQLHFRVEESLDKADSLQHSQFGYLSRHFIVSLREGVDYGVPITADEWKRLSGKKAEIQVRTFLQHAWAANIHDRLYKTDAKIPTRWHRLAARIAALMEDGDNAFNDLTIGVDAYKSYYGAYMTRQKMEAEIKTLHDILACSKEPRTRCNLSLQISRIERSRGNWSTIVALLRPYVDRATSDVPLSDPDVLRELGNALCQEHKRDFGGPEHGQGISLLEKAMKLEPESAEAASLLARAYSHAPDTIRPDRERALELFRRAFELEPTNPYYLTYYLEHELAEKKLVSSLTAIKPLLQRAIETCRSHADAGIELPRAFFVMGRLFLLNDDPYKSLEYYAKGAYLTIAMGQPSSHGTMISELESLERLSFLEKELHGFRWARRFLGLVLHSVTKDASYTHRSAFTADVNSQRFWAKSLPEVGRAVVNIVGTTDNNLEGDLAAIPGFLAVAFDGFKGVLIGGGTRHGVSGMVGELCERNSDSLRSIGYLPSSLPTMRLQDDSQSPVEVDRRYTTNIVCKSTPGFTPDLVIQCWFDLLSAGVRPSEVRVLCIGGGELSAFECRLALALGAQVGLLQNSGRTADALLVDPDWDGPLGLSLRHAPDAPGEMKLLALPSDAYVLKNWVQGGRQRWPEADLRERLGRNIHADYQQNQLKKVKQSKPNLVDWERLPDHFKQSNLLQADDIMRKLQLAGFGCERIPAADRQTSIGDRLKACGAEMFVDPRPTGRPDPWIETLAMEEHGRWVVERLKDGWRYGPEREDNLKIHPFIVAWNKLTQEVQGYDVDAIYNIPRALEAVGLQIVKKK